MSEILTYHQKRVRELRRIIAEIEDSGTASASLSSGVGSRSYTRLDLNTLRRSLASELAAARAEYRGGTGTIGGMTMVRPHFGGCW